MGKIIKTEFLKLKRYSVIKAGIIMTVLSPLLSLFYSTANGGQTWTFDYFMQQVMISNCTLFFPIIIALIAGYIITREYTDDTMKNISTIPIPYKQLLSGKLLVLLLLTIIFIQTERIANGLQLQSSAFCRMKLTPEHWSRANRQRPISN